MKDKHKDSDKELKKRVSLKPNIFQYASKMLKNNMELGMLFPRQVGSTSLLRKLVRQQKKLD